MEKRKNEGLSPNQKHLMSVAGRLSVSDWESNLGNDRLRMSRVMVAKLIRVGTEDVLHIVAEYLGTRIIPDADVESNKALWEEEFEKPYSFEYVHAVLMARGR